MDGTLVEIVLENRRHSVKSMGRCDREMHSRARCGKIELEFPIHYAYFGREDRMQPAAGQEGKITGRCGIVFVLSAPSGAGKTSLSKGIIAAMPDMAQVVTCTTRAPRSGEQD